MTNYLAAVGALDTTLIMIRKPSDREENRNYYSEGIRVLAKQGETAENLEQVYQEYIEAYNTRKAIVDNLYKEIKIIKKLHV